MTPVTNPETPVTSPEIYARRVHVRGLVQGVGFRPFVFRLARAHGLRGWVSNGDAGVCIHVEGSPDALDAFVAALSGHPPQAARVTDVDAEESAVGRLADFTIRASESDARPTTRISPDLSICDECLRELLDASDRRAGYAYINCTNCGPRFSIVRALPYDRSNTTMAGWPLCEACAAEYSNPEDRRFHAQPVACSECGPHYFLVRGGAEAGNPKRQDAGGATAGLRANAIAECARLLREGAIAAVKGIGGYHLACDADNAAAVAALRDRKFRKEKAFAVMVADARVAEDTVQLTAASRALLSSPARPIVLAPSRRCLPGVAPDNDDLGIMLPYAPLHHLLFAFGAPKRLVVTSGNRSSEPIAHDDGDARRTLGGIADALLVGERPIARRVEDSVVRAGALGTVVLRRARGLAPGAAAAFPATPPILALGGDLKSAVTLVVDGQAYVGPHVGDLSYHAAMLAFEESVDDMMRMYGLSARDLVVVHDVHPEYVSTAYAKSLGGGQTIAVQHHRAHIASVLAERGAFDRRVIGVAFDGTGYGDDGAIWGGEIFEGSIQHGFERVAHLHVALLPGGDAAARHPVQAAAGFLAELEDAPDLAAPPFSFPGRYEDARAVVRSGLRTFRTTSAGRLFDTAAALCGFTRSITFEGQAAMWLEHLARRARRDAAPTVAVDFTGPEMDWRSLLAAVIEARTRGAAPEMAARAFHRGLAELTASAVCVLSRRAAADTVVLSGGVMQNALFLDDLRMALAPSGLIIWLNNEVPANDGGLSLGQAALALPAIGAL